MEPLQYTWVSSAGGPLLVAPQSALPLWTGADSTDGSVESWGTTAERARSTVTSAWSR
nr:Imm21 family immunity protein [Micromonospora sp. NRRL B-16802]